MIAEEYGGEIVARSTYLFDPAAAQETATTVVTRMKDAGVTSVILSTDPLIPANITEEATKQGYFPEWIVGPSVLVDTTIFGRTFDQEQWAARVRHLAARRPHRRRLTVGRVHVLRVVLRRGVAVEHGQRAPARAGHAHARHPPRRPGPDAGDVRAGRVPLPAPGRRQDLRLRVLGRDRLLGSAPTTTATDDATAWWWDPEATGEDETGNEGTGMIRYVDGGTRYLPGDWPDELPCFEEEGSVAVYDELPEGDALPDYPPWPGSPAAG